MTVMNVPEKTISADLVVVGGGMAGVCAAIAAARNGCSVVLVQDRPMLGGNASSEVRMHICGAYGEFEKYGPENREGGILQEIMLENYYLNPTLRFTVWDDVLYTMVRREKRITLLLNTTVLGGDCTGDVIRSVEAWGLTDYTRYRISGTCFCDCSGDGILRFSGARYRRGREAAAEFGESHEPEQADRKTMGSSILIQLRRVSEHHPFVAPEWAYHFTDETFTRRDYVQNLDNPNFWWLELGGIEDTIQDAGKIADELLKLAYGAWEYIKNHPNGAARGWELDWVGKLPGKRESIRYIGDHVLTQGDIEAGGRFPDTVCHGGWPMDDHHPEAFFHPGPPNHYYPSPTPFGIPYRCLYSENITNLFFAGRDVSCSHMAMSATRVMGTCAVMGQAVGTAAALACRYRETPRGIYERHLEELQDLLQEQDQFIPGRAREIPELSSRGTCSHEVLRSGIDRFYDGKDNGAWIELGESCFYEFDRPEEISSVRIVFDSNFSDRKTMRAIEGVVESDRKEVPGTIARDFAIECRCGKSWRRIAEEKENRRRCCRIAFAPVKADAVRFVPIRFWNETENRVHLFDFEVAGPAESRESTEKGFESL